MGRKSISLIGKKFGRLFVIGRDETKKHRPYWLCKCDCGEIKEVDGCHLRSGHTQSCGCLQREISGNLARSHGMFGTRFYNIWNHVRDRGSTDIIEKYKGIYTCKEWLNFSNFHHDMYESYLKHVQEHGEKNTSIDRIDNNLGYNKENCRWATCKIQSRNTSKNIMLTHDGHTMCMSEWAEKIGISNKTLWARIKMGWSVDDALYKPIRSVCHD